MPGLKFSIEFEHGALSAALNRLMEFGRRPGPALRDAGEYLLVAHRKRFAEQESPDGDAWTPLSEVTLGRKKRNRDKILIDRGDLMGLLRYQADDAKLDFGSDRIYAAVMQFGAAKGAFGTTARGGPVPWGDIPARPFIGLSGDDRREIEQIVMDHVARAIG